MARAMLAIAVATFVLAPAAAAKTIELHWRESSGIGYPAMTFAVESVTVTSAAWSVRAAVTNRSRHEIRIITEPSPYLPYGFGLFLRDARARDGLPETVSRWVGWRPATSVTALPRAVRARQTWRGTFSGSGRLPRGRAISVTCGVFDSAQLADFGWTSTQTFTL